MQPFSFSTTAHLLCEPGAAGRLAQLCQQRGVRRVLIVTDPGIVSLGMLDDLLPGFTQARLSVAIFSEVNADPGHACVLAAVPDLVARDLARPVHLAFSYDEEVGCQGARVMIDAMTKDGLKPSAVIV